MKTLKFDNQDDWFLARRGKITGSKLKDVLSMGIPKEPIIAELEALGIEHKKTQKKEDLEALLPRESVSKLRSMLPKKVGFYGLIAERLGISPDDESDMARGQRLEGEALIAFTKETNKKVNGELVLWTRDDSESIALSPDGYMGKTEAVEIKCLSSARHIQAFIENKIPDDYWYQVIQYFVVNESLRTLYFVFYDPRIKAKPFFYLKVKRADVQTEVDEILAYEKMMVSQVEEIVNELTF